MLLCQGSTYKDVKKNYLDIGRLKLFSEIEVSELDSF